MRLRALSPAAIAFVEHKGVKELDDCERCMQGLHTTACASVFVNKDFLGHLITVK